MSSENQTCNFVKYANNLSIDESFFQITSIENPTEPTEGQVQVELDYISVDPYLRGRMNKAQHYAGGFIPGKPMDSFVTGKVVKSASQKFQVGQTVCFFGPWTQRQNVSDQMLQPLPNEIKSSFFLGALGMPGLSGLLAMQDIWLKNDEIKNAQNTVFISAAAGAVGSTLGQVCKSYGYTVIGSAGSQQKTDFLKELGFDHTINYKTDNTDEKLAEYAPKGINMYYDNVGGPTLDSALGAMAVSGTIICCGSITGYEGPKENVYGNKNIGNIIPRKLKMQGFLAQDYQHQWGQGTAELIDLYKKQQLKIRETELHGFDKIPEGFIGVLKGKNVGKMIISLLKKGR